MRVNFKVTGIKEIDQAFKELGPKLSKKLLKHGLKEGAKIVATRAKELAPVDSGMMEENIKPRVGKKSRKYVSYKAQVGDRKFDNYYPKFVEHGHAIKRGGKIIGVVLPTHFMQQAKEDKEAQVKAKVEADIREGIKEAKSK